MPAVMEGTRPPTGASPTQPYKCSQNVKVKVNVKTALMWVVKNVGAERVYLGVSQHVYLCEAKTAFVLTLILTLILTY